MHSLRPVPRTMTSYSSSMAIPAARTQRERETDKRETQRERERDGMEELSIWVTILW